MNQESSEHHETKDSLSIQQETNNIHSTDQEIQDSLVPVYSPFNRFRNHGKFGQSNSIEDNRALLMRLFDNNIENVNESLRNQEKLACSLREGPGKNLKSVLKAKYKKQIEYLESNGFKKKNQNIILLSCEDGDSGRVLRNLVLNTLIQESLRIRFNTQLKEIKKQQKKYYTQISNSNQVTKDNEILIIRQSIWQKVCDRKLLQLLEQTNGNVKSTLTLISQDQQEKDLNNIDKLEFQTLAMEGWLTVSSHQIIMRLFRKYQGDWKIIKKAIQIKCFHKIKQLTSNEKEVLKTLNCVDNISESFKQIVLDANNVLFVNSGIRKNCFSKQRDIAERKMCTLCTQFSQITGIHISLIFDQMHAQMKQSNDITITDVKKTLFNSSDDYIYDQILQLTPKQIQTTLIVTSDQELSFRLLSAQSNISIMKGKVFFQHIEELLSSQLFFSITNNNNI